MNNSKKSKLISVLLWVLLIVFLMILLYSGYRIFDYYSEKHPAESTYEDVISRFRKEESEQPPTEPTRDDEPTDGTEEPALFFPERVDTAAIAAEYEDFRGWLYCPDTVIDYPVMQGADNEKYLHHLIDGSYNYNGCLFIDFRCSSDFSDRNTVIYGHNMRSGIMFGTLQQYKKAEYYEEHPVLYLQTAEKKYCLEVVSAYTTRHDSKGYGSFNDDTAYLEYLEEIRDYAAFDSPVELDLSSKIVTLSTCAYDFDNARFLVVCKLTEIK